MATATQKGGASASPDRLGLIDWISLAAFTAPILAATIHSLAGVA